MMPAQEFRVRTLGVVRCDATRVADVPSAGLPSRVVLAEEYRAALAGVQTGDFMYVVTIFHLADPGVLAGSPGTPFEQGAFSIRSSCRPNIIGMTLAKVTGITGAEVAFDWLDFVDGTPVIDLKRYNWRWECALSARRLDRRFIEKQVSRQVLEKVLARPAASFHGEYCHRVLQVGQWAARLVQEHDVWIGNPEARLSVRGDGHVIDSVMPVTGATLGNGRLEVAVCDTDPVISLAAGTSCVVSAFRDGAWEMTAE